MNRRTLLSKLNSQILAYIGMLKLKNRFLSLAAYVVKINKGNYI